MLILPLPLPLTRSGLMVADEIISRADSLKVASDKAPTLTLTLTLIPTPNPNPDPNPDPNP